MKRRFVTFCLAILCALVTACDVHEFPEPPVPPVKLNLNLKFSFGLGMLIDFKTIYVETRAAAPEYEARYQLRIHPADEKGGFRMDSCQAYVFSQTELDSLNHRVSLELVPGQYRFRAWVDFVAQGTESDHFYDTTDFNAITLRNPYVGNSDYRDAFRGVIDGEVLPAEVSQDQELQIQMERPMAKYRFIATDLKEFEEQYLRQAEKEGVSAPPPIDLGQYKVRLFYGGFLPAVFSLSTDEPIDVLTGVSFDGTMRKLTDEEVEMAFDYVLVSKLESGVNVTLTVYDEAGKLIANVPDVAIPLRRGQLTTVRGNFLTAKSAGAVSIDPSFDGEFNVPL